VGPGLLPEPLAHLERLAVDLHGLGETPLLQEPEQVVAGTAGGVEVADAVRHDDGSTQQDLRLRPVACVDQRGSAGDQGLEDLRPCQRRGIGKDAGRPGHGGSIVSGHHQGAGKLGLCQHDLRRRREAFRIAQGFLEDSNVSVVEEMVNMILGQRAYEANSRVIRAADEMLQQVNNLPR